MHKDQHYTGKSSWTTHLKLSGGCKNLQNSSLLKNDLSKLYKQKWNCIRVSHPYNGADLNLELNLYVWWLKPLL